MNTELLGWLKASGHRRDIVLCLAEEDYLTPTEIEERTGHYLSHVSGTLTDLEGRGIAECITPDRQKGRLYSLTETGQALSDAL